MLPMFTGILPDLIPGIVTMHEILGVPSKAVRVHVEGQL